jgi:hypothetical protein
MVPHCTWVSSHRRVRPPRVEGPRTRQLGLSNMVHLEEGQVPHLHLCEHLLRRGALHRQNIHLVIGPTFPRRPFPFTTCSLSSWYG